MFLTIGGNIFTVEFVSEVGGGEVCRVSLPVPALAIDIVNIDTVKSIVHFVQKWDAFWSEERVVAISNSSEITLLCINLILKLLRNHASIVSHIKGCGSSIVSPVSDSIANHEALKIDLSILSGLVVVVLIDEVGEKWNINSSIRLTSQEHCVLSVWLIIKFIKEA